MTNLRESVRARRVSGDTVMNVTHCLRRKRLAFRPAKFGLASTSLRSDWQKRHADEHSIAHGSEAV
jgi:hypothetical protein